MNTTRKAKDFPGMPTFFGSLEEILHDASHYFPLNNKGQEIQPSCPHSFYIPVEAS